MAGIHFTRNYPSSLDHVELLQEQNKSSATERSVNTKEPLMSPAELSKLKALSFMRGIMDECTHLGNFTPPVDPTLSIVVSAEHDAYVPRIGTKPLGELWKGCEMRYIDAGHITAFLFNHGVFR